MNKLRTIALVLGFCGAAGFPPVVVAGSIVVPSSNAEFDGNVSNTIPFDIDTEAFASVRYQQVYLAAEFGNSPLLIEQILFRPDRLAVGTAFDSVLPDIQINLSTTSRDVDGLSFLFADNVGADDTAVVSRGELALSSNDTAGPRDSRAFDIVIELQTPFVYRPDQGNLLLDVRNYGGGSTTAFDAQTLLVRSGSVSRLFRADVNSALGSVADSFGLITSFTVTEIPEPSSLGLAACLVGAARFPGRGAASRRCAP